MAEQQPPATIDGGNPTLDAVQTLQDINRQIADMERKLNKQRIDTAILTVELSTLHDPIMRETLALCYQSHHPVAKNIEACESVGKQILQDVQSDTQEKAQHVASGIQEISPQEPPPQLPGTSQELQDQNQSPAPSGDPQTVCPATSGSD